MSEGARYLVGVDVGTTTVKAVAVGLGGERLAAAQAPTPIVLGDGGKAEHPAELLRETVLAVLRDLVARLGAGRPVAAVAVTSMGEAGAFIDASGAIVRPPIGWSDARARGQVDQLEEAIGRGELYRITGHVPDPSWGIAKCMWIRANEPRNFERARTWLSISDLVVLWLSGARVTDPSIASRTMALDQATGDWSSRVLAAAQIDPALMPEVRPSGTVAGELSGSAAAVTGLAKGTPVVLGGHDRLCGAFAARAGEDLAIDSAGTAESLVLSLPHAEGGGPGIVEAAEIARYRDIAPDHDAYSARVGLAGGLLEWVRRCCFEVPGETPPEFEAMMAELPSLDGPPEVVCLPSFGRGIAPSAGVGGIHGMFVGLVEHHRRGDLLRACLEAPAFSLRANLEALERIVDGELTVRAEGGLVRNPRWMQIRADVLGREFESVDIADLAAVGAALIAGVGAGVFADLEEAGSVFTPPRRTWVPEADRARAYEVVYEGVFAELAVSVGPLSRALTRGGE